jgi:DNA-binding Lrp family transcriptional regulator
LRSDLLRIDPVDQAILSALGRNARQTLSQIGAQVNLSPPAVKRRIDRLEESGVIVGYAAIVDPAALGTTTDAFVELYCRNRTSPKDILDAVKTVPEVLSAFTVSGDADALLRVRTSGMPELEDALERLRAHPNTERTKTVIVLSTLMERRSS